MFWEAFTLFSGLKPKIEVFILEWTTVFYKKNFLKIRIVMCMAIFLWKTEKVHQLYSFAKAWVQIWKTEKVHHFNTLTKAWVQNMISLSYCNHVMSWKKDFYRRQETKVVTAVWGTEFIQFLAPPAFLHQDDLK